MNSIDEVGPSVAGRWFGVRAEYERFGPVRTVWVVVRELLLALVTLGIFMGEWDPKRLCNVVVFERGTGVTVALLKFDHLREATYYVSNLRGRLGTEPVFDFCRELGIPMSDVVGPGQTPDLFANLRWVEVPRRQLGGGERT